ncbi:ExbD/TolR family protein [Erythrobacter sp. MTPC3]|uniref:ExbD/TolR family protein n=1 Tax=Erythrobacter sp. MTPC3 TaxID=3056564 RepID=UPI0036F3BE93
MTTQIIPYRSRFSGSPRKGPFRRKQPMGEMNVTPFIDVLLVLLIMVILAVPMPTHQTSVELPGEPPVLPLTIAEENTVFITANDDLLWNGEPVTHAQLSASVAAVTAMDEEPLLRFEPAALASYDMSAKTISLIRDAGAERFAFVENARHKDFGL